MKRNDDSPLVDAKRNTPVTNAERQRRYRDRKRGGPSCGRWPLGYVTIAQTARLQGVSRSMLFMARWLRMYAPDVIPKVESGELKVTPIYQRRRSQLAMQIAKQLVEGGRDDE